MSMQENRPKPGGSLLFLRNPLDQFSRRADRAVFLWLARETITGVTSYTEGPVEGSCAPDTSWSHAWICPSRRGCGMRGVRSCPNGRRPERAGAEGPFGPRYSGRRLPFARDRGDPTATWWNRSFRAGSLKPWRGA